MIKAVEHFSFTVGNLEASLHFFCDQLGLEAGAIMEVDHEGVRRVVGMPSARLRIALVSLPGGPKLELIEYVEPKGCALDLSTNNTGVAHLAFEVADIERLYRDLSAQGIVFVSAPVWAPSNDGKGRWGVCYLRGPDGLTFELIERQ